MAGIIKSPAHSSRQRYRVFLQDYKHRRLDDPADPAPHQKPVDGSARSIDTPSDRRSRRGKRRQYLREYLRWLWPHRYGVGTVLVCALLAAILDMIQPLFMRFIIDRVLLNTRLDTASRLAQLHGAGMAFLVVILLSSLIGAVKDYRQRIVNAKVTLSLRRSLFQRLLHLPLAKLWDMKTGGILSRLTGDVETTTGLLQLALVSPGEPPL